MPRRARVPDLLKKRPFTLDEARELGVSRRVLQGKSWRRLGSRLYCWTGLRDDPWQILVAWRQLLPPDAAFAGLTAAWLYGLDVDPCHPIEVVVPANSGVRSRPGLFVRRCCAEIANVRGLRATTPHQTFRDLERRLPAMEFLVLADQALCLQLGRFSELAERAESPMETRLRWLLIEAGLPRPCVQSDLRDTDGRFIGRADLYYPQAKLAIEYDGATHRERLVEDNRRQNALLNAGFRLLRFTAADLLQRPDSIAAQVRSAFSAETKLRRRASL